VEEMTLLSRNIFYLVVDYAGTIQSMGSVPASRFEDIKLEKRRRLIIPEDGKPPENAAAKLNVKGLPTGVISVPSLAEITIPVEPPSAEVVLELRRSETLAIVDAFFASAFASIRGPLAELHAEKRKQAEAGGGPLIVDEEDRVAILAKAKAQDDQIAKLEQERRTTKAALVAAVTIEEIAAIIGAAGIGMKK
jgi:hypothetical protein